MSWQGLNIYSVYSLSDEICILLYVIDVSHDGYQQNLGLHSLGAKSLAMNFNEKTYVVKSTIESIVFIPLELTKGCNLSNCSVHLRYVYFGFPRERFLPATMLRQYTTSLCRDKV